MRKIFNKIEKWIDFNLGWFLTNGHEYKQERYRQYLKDKYPEDYQKYMDEAK